jgi:hypothetical protein
MTNRTQTFDEYYGEFAPRMREIIREAQQNQLAATRWAKWKRDNEEGIRKLLSGEDA